MSLIIIVTMKISSKLPESQYESTIPELESNLPRTSAGVRCSLQTSQSGWYILGQEVEAFETEFAAYCKTQYCVGVGNGLEALHLILGYGDWSGGMKLCAS